MIQSTITRRSQEAEAQVPPGSSASATLHKEVTVSPATVNCFFLLEFQKQGWERKSGISEDHALTFEPREWLW